MSDAIKKFEAIKIKLEGAVSKRNVLIGKEEAVLEELKKHGYDSIEEADLAIIQLDKEADEVSAKLDGLIAEFNDKFPELTGESNGQD